MDMDATRKLVATWIDCALGLPPTMAETERRGEDPKKQGRSEGSVHITRLVLG